MRDTPKWRSNIILTSAVALGAAVALTAMNLVWALATEPASCDTARLPDGSLVIPMCVVPGPPGILTLIVAVAGAAVGYAIYRRYKRPQPVG
jgi:uncharacterized membrane protein